MTQDTNFDANCRHGGEMSYCKTCNNWRNVYRTPIMIVIWHLILRWSATGQACGECGRLLRGRFPTREDSEKLASRTIKRARYKEPTEG